MKQFFLRVASLLLSGTLLVAMNPTTVLPVAAEQADTYASSSNKTNDLTYSNYIADHSSWTYAAEGLEGILAAKGEVANGGSLSFSISVPTDALYELQLQYHSLKEQNIILAIHVDGVLPFSEAEHVTFPAFWTNAGDVRKDDLGNEFVPEQALYGEDTKELARDYSGRHEDPYRFALTAGTHTVTLTLSQGALVVNRAVLAAPEQVAAYKAPTGLAAVNDYAIIEGEDAALKSNRALIALCDNSSAVVNPSSPVSSKLNYIGGSNWKTPGDSITWNFHVKTAGYYNFKFQFRQSELLGGVSFRHMTIDGVTPFKEAERIAFPYGSDWQNMAYCDDNKEPYRVWLGAGDHTLTLTATAGPMAEIYSAMQTVTAEMGDLYVAITKIVGETVDVNRSYELFNQIPGFNDDLDTIIGQLDDICLKMEAMQKTKTGSTVSSIRNAQRVVQQMRSKPYSAHRYKSQFYDAYTNLSALMGTMVEMPLDIDQIVISGEGAEVPRTTPTLLQRIAFTSQRFVATFSDDYQMVSGEDADKGSLTLWVGWGRDQAQVLNELIQDDFVRKTGIQVRVQLVNASLIQAILAGSGPDCQLQMTRTEPVNLAMRGALVDLTQFSDLDEVLKRFNGGAADPYRYKDGLYALPDTQSFYMMFARTDILDSLGLKLPETWDDFINAAIILQRNNLQAGLPYTKITDSGAANGGVGGTSLYPTLLAQKGLPMYADDKSASTLTRNDQIAQFSKWVNWYKKYKIPTVMDFFNRFRIGSAPIGISSYSLYTQLKAAAPEIDGRWTATMIPGTPQEDGSINRISAGSGTGCSITKLSRDPEKAWKFLKWWTDAETQSKYSNNLESVLGYLGRVPTSNVKALESMNWDSAMLKQLSLQRQNVQEIPEVPGGYYTARGIDQAFWAVVEQGESAPDALLKWGAVVDSEIARKTAEYATEN